MGRRQLGEAAADILPYALLAAGAGAWQARRRRTWVRISSGGIELAAHGGDPVLLDWPEVVSARVPRLRGPRSPGTPRQAGNSVWRWRSFEGALARRRRAA